MDNPLFLLENIRYAYDRTNVLDLEYLSVSRAQITVIAGPNGAGKTTLLKVINSLLLPAGGTIRYKNELLKYMKMPGKESMIRRETVLVHQEPFVFTGSVFQNVAYGLKIRHTPHREIQKKVRENLALVGLADFEKRKASELSGGERQRVFIARALAQNSSILLLDEPTSFLDLKHQVGIYDLRKGAQTEKGKTIIAVTHDINLTSQYCDEMLLLGADGSYQIGQTRAVLSSDRIRKVFDVEVFGGKIGQENFFIPLGKFSRDRGAIGDEQP